MSPDEQKQFIARMKERGGDTSAFESAGQGPAASRNAAAAQPSTIDALFAPLPVVESRGRAWLYVDKILKPINLRLGISDGTNTEVISDDVQDATEVVTGVTGIGPTRNTPAPAGAGNPFTPGRGGRGGRG
jgi:hypothetical protein